MTLLRVVSLSFLLFLPVSLAGQQRPAVTQALDLERRGDYAGAVEAYKSLLRVRPGDATALLGLERSLLPLNRSGEMVGVLQAALAAAPTNSAVYGIALRSWAAAGRLDSVRSLALRWSRISPNDETPYREWGAAELLRQNRAGARAAYELGRAQLRRPDALAAELAQLAVTEGNYAEALQEWLLATRRFPGYRGSAVATLGQAPEDVQPALLRALSKESDFLSRRLEAELRARWDDPDGAVRVLTAALPPDRIQSVAALQTLLEQLRLLRTRDGKLAQAHVLEALADRLPGAQGARLRLDAAQAYSAAEDKENARRMLGGLADDRTTPASISSGAAATLITVLIGEGKFAEAQKRLNDARAALPSDDYDDLRRSLAAGWMRAGELARADSAIAPDSSVEGLALAGRIRLFRGDIAGAISRFKEAGPYTKDREEATRRTALLALLQPLDRDSFPELGRALLLLEQGDTAQAAAGLEQVATGLGPQHGGAEFTLLAGRLLRQTGNPKDAERLFRAADAPEAPGTAPAAELALADLLVSSQRPGEAVAVLEHLTLTYPQSALVPQARRQLDEARGAVPKT
ncbi:MAG TPA: tetratricopeptide repeat protein [Gemmatimonadales bacterium]